MEKYTRQIETERRFYVNDQILPDYFKRKDVAKRELIIQRYIGDNKRARIAINVADPNAFPYHVGDVLFLDNLFKIEDYFLGIADDSKIINHLIKTKPLTGVKCDITEKHPVEESLCSRTEETASCSLDEALSLLRISDEITDDVNPVIIKVRITMKSSKGVKVSLNQYRCSTYPPHVTIIEAEMLSNVVPDQYDFLRASEEVVKKTLHKQHYNTLHIPEPSSIFATDANIKMVARRDIELVHD